MKIKNFKNSKVIESPKYKNTTKFGPKSQVEKTLGKQTKKEERKKEGNLPKPLPSFSFFRPLLSLLIYYFIIINSALDGPKTKCFSPLLTKILPKK